jgi:Rod binding domain-containing protein
MQAIAVTAAESGSENGAAPQPRLVRAAHEFEAQMMNELLKPLTSGGALTGDEEDSSSGSGGALGQFASEALGQALSEHGGFGIAQQIVRELSPASNRNGTAK